MTPEELLEAIGRQRTWFRSGKTLDWRSRCHSLRRLYDAVVSHSEEVEKALYEDLHKSPFESYACETGLVLTELKEQIRLCRKMRNPQRVTRSLFTLNGRSRIKYEPYGLTLIVSPWNYPFHLSMLPLCGAVAAGNVVTLKLSPDSPHVNAVVRKIVESVFRREEVLVVEGHREVNTLLFQQRWNHIFLTGSPDLGKVAMASAANHLTPITLELGGKSPCIVDADADIEVAAKRIVYGKCINAGQTCIAPDYLMVHSSVKEPLLDAMRRHYREFYGNDAQRSEQYPRIVNDKSMRRLSRYIDENMTRIVWGGRYDLDDRFVELTCVDFGRCSDVEGSEEELLNREIFGPIFPVLVFDAVDEAVNYVNGREKPLAFYYFTRSRRKARYVLSHTTSGGACVNDTLMHITNPHMPFGGVENSGLGCYHGRYSYEAFSHRRSVLFSSRWLDFWFKYPPFKPFWTRWVKKLMK